MMFDNEYRKTKSMPKMDGFEATSEIKAMCPETKILALTVHEEEAYILKALEVGADA